MIDNIQVNFDESSLLIMNIVISFIMFGVALDLKLEDFKHTLNNPKSVLIGMLCQYLLLPFATFILVLIVQPQPSIALGLFLVAACPGGNLSNFLTYLAKGKSLVYIARRGSCCIKLPLALMLIKTPYGVSQVHSLLMNR